MTLKPFIVVFKLSGLSGTINMFEGFGDRYSASDYLSYLNDQMKTVHGRLSVGNRYFPGAVLKEVVGSYAITSDKL